MFDQRELHELEDGCVQEHLPTCMAACPIHVDVRAVLADIATGNLAGGLKTLRRTLPFPGIIGRVCPAPCQPVCKRTEAGDALQIAALERACADLGGNVDKPRVLPRKAKRVAVVGAGLSGLTAAYDLGRKGYGIEIFEATNRVGGSLWEIPEDVLARDVLTAELDVVAQIGAVIHTGQRCDAGTLAALAEEFDGVYLATGSGGETFGLELDQDGRLAIDPITFATSRDGVFAGGGLLHTAAERSPIESVSHGRRAALSLDRHLQKVSLTASRVIEGSLGTRLYTNTEGLEPLAAVPIADPGQGFDRDGAAREAQRCIQCECMECVKSCEYLKHYRHYPRKYIREIYNNLSIVKPGERKANKFINSCSMCGLCGEICPTDLNMADIVKRSRAIMVQQKRMPPSAHDFALRDMAYSNSEAFTLARHRPGRNTSRYVFFPGCQLPATSPGYVGQVYDYLTEQLGDVGLMLRCCGAPAEWAGRPDLLQESMDQFRRQHRELGEPTVVLACSSCHRAFTEHCPDVPVVSLWTLMAEQGLPKPPTTPLTAGPVTVHDPCSTRHESQMHDSVRGILGGLGYQVEELPLSRERTECCSYGGDMWLANRELAEAVVQRRIGESDLDFVTYCAVCRDFFAARGKRTVHLLDLIFGPDPDQSAARRGPGYSERHENRARVKRTLLAQLWGEDMDGSADAERIRMEISDDVRATLEDRLILDEDLRRVIEIAERTGGKLLNRRTGHWLAHQRLNVITYWVEYTQEGDAFVVHNAYSHRMHVDEGAGA